MTVLSQFGHVMELHLLAASLTSSNLIVISFPFACQIMKWSCELDLKYLTAEVKLVIPFIESIHNPSLYLISE